LQTVKRELEQEQALKMQVEEKLHVVESSVEELQGRTEALEQEKVDLRQQNTLLMLENVILSDTKVKLERKATELLHENEDLHNTVRCSTVPAASYLHRSSTPQHTQMLLSGHACCATPLPAPLPVPYMLTILVNRWRLWRRRTSTLRRCSTSSRPPWA
jgi:hypothetical protein